MEKKESLSPQQAHTRKHHSVMLESSTSKKKIAEQSMDCNTEGVGSLEIPVVSEVFKHEEDDDAIFKKLNIPWLSEKASSF